MVPQVYTSLEAIVAAPAEEMAIVGKAGMVRWRYYGERAAVVLLLGTAPQDLVGYKGTRLHPTADTPHEYYPLWGRRERPEADRLYREGRVRPTFDYAVFFESDALPAPKQTMAALMVQRYRTDPPVREVFRFLRIVPWSPDGGNG
jgi:hypothetical protein